MYDSNQSKTIVCMVAIDRNNDADWRRSFARDMQAKFDNMNRDMQAKFDNMNRRITALELQFTMNAPGMKILRELVAANQEPVTNETGDTTNNNENCQ